METDLELSGWQADWQAATLRAPSDLGTRVASETRRMRWTFALRVLITAGSGGWTLARALSTREPLDVVFAGGTWTFLVIGWLIAIVIHRGIWRPVGATTVAFLDLSVARARRQRQRLAVSVLYYVAFLTFALLVVHAEAMRDNPLSLSAFLLSRSVVPVWIVTAVLAACGVWRRRYLSAKLVTLETLRRAMADTGD